MTDAHNASWLHSLIPTSASWAVIATELAAVFLITAILFGWFAWRGRKARIEAARLLLAERDAMAESATDTMNMHMEALLPKRPLTETEKDDYFSRSNELIGQLCKPWLHPSEAELRQTARAILAIRHSDLHQMASLFSTLVPDEQDNAKIADLNKDLEAAREAEKRRSSQLQEALTTIGKLVAEYGRKYAVSTDDSAHQILRGLLYLQALDAGSSEADAKEFADEALSEDLEIFKTSPEPNAESPAQPETPADETVSEGKPAADNVEDTADKETAVEAESTPTAQIDTPPEQAPAPAKETAASLASKPEAKTEPAPTSPKAPELDGLDELDDIDALLAQTQQSGPPAAQAPSPATDDTAVAAAKQDEDKPAAPPASENPAVDETPSSQPIDSGRDEQENPEEAPADQQPRRAGAATQEPPSAPPEARVEEVMEPAGTASPSSPGDSATATEQTEQPATPPSRPAVTDEAATNQEAAAQEAAKDAPVEKAAAKNAEESSATERTEPAVAPSSSETQPEDEEAEETAQSDEAEEPAVVDLDNIELPEQPAVPKSDQDAQAESPANASDGSSFDLDLDDIDALLDAEISRHETGTNTAGQNEPSDEDLDLSK